MENQIFCQSCAMPMSEEHFGTNADGTPNQEYCIYCYENGAFKQDVTMEGMIEHCLQFLDEFNAASETKFTADEARKEMMKFFPMLKRWKKEQ